MRLWNCYWANWLSTDEVNLVARFGTNIEMNTIQDVVVTVGQLLMSEGRKKKSMGKGGKI